MRWAVAIAGALVIAGCSQKAEKPPANQSSATEKTAIATENASAVNASGNAATAAPQNSAQQANKAAPSAGVLPPANAAVRYVGTWATKLANCKSKPWHFTARELTVSGGPHCSFYNVAKVPGGYDVAAQCPTKGPVHTDLIKLRFAESAQAMLVESNAINPTGLIYCGK
jgi:hypothetical protein